MGRGDKKTKKGKISMGSYGNSRPRIENKQSSPTAIAEKPAKADKPAAAKEKKK